MKVNKMLSIVLLCVFVFCFMSYAEITPVADRTPAVRDAVVKAIEGVDTAADVTDAQLASVTVLDLRNKEISELKAGDFSGLTGLVNLNLYGNKLASLPTGIFEGLTALTTIRLGRNSVNPMPFTVSLEKVASGQFKAVAPAGALFDIVLPVTVAKGSLTSSVATLTIPKGSIESGTLSVTRTPGTTAAVTVTIGTLPSLPSRNHYGYTLVKSDSLPLAVISGINTAPIFTDGTTVTRSVAENTDAGVNIGTPVGATDTENDALTYTLSGTDADAFDIDSTTGQLKTKVALDYETKSQYMVTITASDGTLTDTITVTIDVTDIDEVVVPVDPPISPDPPTTNTAPTFSEGERTARAVPENTDAGVDIGTPVAATDAENDALTYTLSGPDADAFDIDSTTGQLKTKVALDYETKRVYSVTITVADETLSDTIVMIISVIDVNDTPISAGFVPVADRTPQVRDAIVAAVPNVAAASDVTETQVAAITSLNLRRKGIASLKTGDFSGMVSLSNLNLFGNQLRSIPAGLFSGLTALTTLRLGGNAIDPLPLIVSLQQVSTGEFRAAMPSAAPFNVVLPIRVTDGTIQGGITTVTISQGRVESPSFTVDGTSAKVSFGTFPALPQNHFGYTLTQTAIFNRTPEVAEAILKTLDVNDPSAVTDTDIAMITRLDVDNMDITSLSVDDFAGMLSLQTLTLSNNKLTTLPVGIFSDVKALVNLSLEGNSIATLPSNVFEGLSLLLTLNLADNELAGLSGTLFDGIPNIRSLSLSNNKLTTLPPGIFEGLTQLNQLLLNGNAVDPVPMLVSLQKVGEDQFMARVLAGAPSSLTLPITVKNGEIVGGLNAVTIPIAQAASQPLTVERTPGTVDAVTVDFGTLPKLPAAHNGYALVTSGTLPLEVLAALNVPPVFTEGADTVRSIRENTAADTDIGEAVSATDQDTADTLTYTLGGTDADSFGIDAATGQLKTKAALDYETKNRYSVVVTVSDGIASDSITVSIVVIDIDENRAPVFSEGDRTTRSVAENTDAGENIGEAVTATDADDDTLTYSLAGTDAAAFSLNPQTGQLKTSAALDYETKNVYNVVLNASDGKLTTPITVVISITDVAEETPSVEETDDEQQTQTANNPPVFAEGASTTRTVLEGTAAGEDIGQAVTATDADGHTLTYSLGGTDAVAFSMDSTNGQLRTEAALDYETKSTYTIIITASDGTETDTITVTINVVDATENSAPTFTAGNTATRSVAENTGSGVDIGTAIAATDVNEDTLTYSLGGTDAASFSIDSTTGQLRTDASLDYETKNAYTVTITVSDGNGGSDSITVTINVTDVDETLPNSAPVFSGESITRSVAENTNSGVNIGSPIAATDADDDNLTYSLGGTDAVSFSMDSTTGQLRTDAPLDYETKNDYTVTITVYDGKGGTDSITVTINVTDVQENRAPVFTDGASTTRAVAENTGSGIDIGSPIAATDADNDSLNYSLGGTDAASFSIDSTRGQLRTDAPLDYEKKTNYTVTITVSDGRGGSDSITVRINVTDVEEAPANNPPAFDEDETTRTIAENTDADANIGAAITATDADGDDLTYSLGGTDASAFAIDGKTGQLKTEAALDFETKESYAVTVIASDGTLTDSISVTINVSNVNEAPEFTEGASATRAIAENVPENINIGSAVAATDPEKSKLTYTLGGTNAAAFSIDDATGQLKTKAALDFEDKDSYSVTITVSDGNLTDTITVTINVTDLEETEANTPPVFDDGASTTRSVAENAEADENIGTPIAATDVDENTLAYLLSGTDAAAFAIDSTTGQLKTSAALNHETKATYTVNVVVSDGSDTDTISVTINVTDVNEAPVIAANTDTTRSVPENATAGTNIGSAITATDQDDGDTLTWTLGGTDADSFSIVRTTGQLQTKATLDYESKSQYEVTVSVSDGNLTDTIDITINVTDINENRAPVFSDGTSTTRSIAENTGSGQNIGSAVAATDADENTLTYTLGGTDASSFSIVGSSGQLRTKAALDYEDKNRYSVTVSVSDGNGGTDSITVTINVTDVQENRAPAFSSNTATRSIAENTGSGQNIGAAITATDADGDDLTYTLAGTDASSFSIVSASGQLQTKAALDYERKTQYEVTVSVSDGSLEDTITVTINVTDVAENSAPVFGEGDTATRSVAEDTGTGQDIGSAVEATDADSSDTLTYSLGGTDEASFSIVSNSGQLRTKAALDYERKTQYEVTVSVSDGKGGSDSITVTINVTDVQENRAPVFTDGASTTRSIAENTGTGQDIGAAVGATDADNNSLTYTLGGTDAASFSIVSASGQLRTKAALDYESKSEYSVTVSVSDGNLEDTITVTINVTDVAENSAPVFGEGDTATRSVAEDTGTGQNIGDAVEATDADSSDTLTYSLGGTDASSFDIVTSSGQLQTKVALNFESKNQYSVTVSVSDGKGGSDSINVTINVTNVNEAPVFSDGASATRSIDENTDAGQNIGAAVGATDPENNNLTYSLGGTDASSFAIVTSSGQLQTKAALNYETKSRYSVTVSVSDGNGGSASITVTINVTDVQETQTQVAVNSAPVFTDGASTTRSVAEDTGTGQDIGSAVGATDADSSDTLTYTLGGTDKDSFSIVGTSGQLRTKATLDFESKSSYEVTVSVSDGKGGSDSITVTINVTDVQENRAPVFTDGASTTRSIAENTGSGQDIGAAVAATDADSDKLTYTLGGTNSASFSIVGTSGQLQTKAALNYETKSEYSVTVSVSDGNGGSDSITVTINVTDVNEAPVFSDGTSTTRSIAENTAAGQDIGSAVGATDPENNSLTYSLSGTDEASFAIVTTSGQLQTKAALNYETKSSYEVTVSVTDGSFTTTIAVTINVTDVNETPVNSAPVFTDGTSTTRSVAENTAAGQNIGSAVAATDADSGASLTYSLGGTDASSFDIVTSSGQLQTKATLNYETKSSYKVTVSVTDGNGGSDSITVTINVSDVNEAPVFSDGASTTRSIAENTAAEQNIGPAVGATDPENNSLTYSLGGTDASSFAIVTSSGQLQTKATLNYETKSSYKVTVSVTDGNSTTTIPVTINVTDVNEAPVFSDGTSTTRSIAENTAAGQDIGTAVGATDPENNSLTYSLGGTDASSFAIVTSSGQLQTKAALNYETKSSYKVTVSVTDGSSTTTIPVTINVTDVQETQTPVNSVPVFTDGESTTRSIAENTGSGQNIGDAVAATDADSGDSLTYSLGGTDAASFAIVSTSGQLQTKADLDFEAKSSYEVTVSVSDGNGGTDSITVNINVTDVTETTTTPTQTEETQTTITPVTDRTPFVRDAIVAAVPGVSSAENVTATHLAAITSLALIGSYDGQTLISGLTTLKSGDFSGLTGLTSLDLSNNEIVRLPEDIFSGLTALTSLSLYSNLIGAGKKKFPLKVLSDLSSLTTLNLGFNDFAKVPLEALSKVSTTLTSLDMSETYLEDLSADAFKGLSSLQTLKLGPGNTILKIKANAFRGLSSLTSLDLHDQSYMTLVADSFKGLSSLQTLNLSSHELETLPLGIFSGLSSLLTLDLSDGAFTSLPSGIFSGLSSLKTLNLSNNDLPDDSLPSDIFSPLTSLTSLDLSGNESDFDEFYGTADWAAPTGEAPNAVTRGAVPGVSTSVLQNYPNPFNPETWIPYQLAEATKVSLTIYDVRGVVVRTLDLGLKPAGRYINRSRAAYWDGRNSVGEKVAAGLYFYMIKAGDFTAMRKMLILK